MNIRYRKAAFAALLLAGTMSVPAQAAEATVVEYENLSQLLTEGCLELQQANDSYYSNKQNYEEMVTELRNERDYMKLLADQSEEDSEEEAAYKASASVLSASITQVNKRLERLNRKSSTLTVRENLDTYTKTAQTRMMTYNQLVLMTAAQEKAAEAAGQAYEDAKIQQAAGLMTAEEVLQAADRWEQQKNELESCRQQTESQRSKLLALLGLTGQETVIGTVPEPDLAKIDQIDLEQDKKTALGYDDEVKNARHASAGTPGEVEQRARNEAEAEGTVTAEITAAYQELNTERTEYEAALAARENAVLAYQTVQLKAQAGMLSEADRLEGEAEYLQAEADYGSAAMELVQAYEDYCWLVVGI